MGCGCGSQPAEKQYLVTLPDGSTKVASGEIQARQMIAKAGGGKMKPAPAST